jgi:hypothetical protein
MCFFGYGWRSNVPHVVSPLAKGAKLPHVRIDLDFHVHHMASSWNPSGSTWAQLQPNMTNWRQLGVQLRPERRSLGPSWAQAGPSGAQREPILRIQCDMWKACIFSTISMFFWLWCRSADVRGWRCRSADVRVWRCRSANVRVWRCITTAAFLRRNLRRRSRE